MDRDRAAPLCWVCRCQATGPWASLLTDDQTQNLPGKWKTKDQAREAPEAWAAGTWEESCTSLSSWVRTRRSGDPLSSRSGTWSKGLRMVAFLLKLLGWFQRVAPKTKHTSAGAGPRSPSTTV